MKQCSRCKVEKPLIDFSKQTRNTDGLRPYCKSCDNAISKVNYEKNKDIRKMKRLCKN